MVCDFKLLIGQIEKQGLSWYWIGEDKVAVEGVIVRIMQNPSYVTLFIMDNGITKALKVNEECYNHVLIVPKQRI